MIQKTFFFDIGNVQLFFDHRKMVKEIAALFGLEPSLVEDLFFKKNLLVEWELGKINSHFLYNTFSALANRSSDFASFCFACSNIFTPNTPLFSLIETLKADGSYLVLLSNIGDAHFDFISSHYPIFSSFDARLLSFEVNLRKPHPQIYQKALALAKGPSIYIDDIEEYVLAARKQGLDSERFETCEKLRKQLITKGFINEKNI